MKFKGLTDEEAKRLVPENLILLGYRGSIAHNTYEPSTNPNSIDDKDIMGVFVANLNNYIGLEKKEHHEAFIHEWDAVSYEIRKYINLLLKCNPNVLALLWLEDKHYLYKSDVGRLLIANRRVFVSKQAYHSFNGYAWGQFKRMIHFKFEGYMGDKRKQLVEKHGYDTKNAAHLIRILEMGIEFLTEGTLYVARQNAQKLLDIKHGNWTLEQVKTEAEKLFTLAHEAYVKSTLPAQPDRKAAEELLMRIICDYHSLNKKGSFW
jgi:predicted nucleotidyltransferase